MHVFHRIGTGHLVGKVIVRRTGYLVALSGLCLALGGCDRIPGMRAAPVSTVDGTYRGELAQRTFGRPSQCIMRVEMVVTLKAGEARGELLSVEQRGQPVGSFYAFVEPDGRVKTTARVGAQTLALDGSFGGREFSANAEGEKCSMYGTARRADGG